MKDRSQLWHDVAMLVERLKAKNFLLAGAIAAVYIWILLMMMRTTGCH